MLPHCSFCSVSSNTFLVSLYTFFVSNLPSLPPSLPNPQPFPPPLSQWFKAFFDKIGTVQEDYSPLAVRSRGKGGKDAKKHLVDRAAEAGSKLLPGDRTTIRADGKVSQYSHASTKDKRVVKANMKDHGEGGKKKEDEVAHALIAAASSSDGAADAPAPEKPAAKKTAANPAAKPADKKRPLKESSAANAAPPSKNSTLKRTHSASTTTAPSSRTSSTSKAALDHATLKKTHVALRLTVDGLEKERDFYFDKLRDIEVMLQAYQEKQEKRPAVAAEENGAGEMLIGNVFRILYATTEEGVTVNDEGEVTGGREGGGGEEEERGSGEVNSGEAGGEGEMEEVAKAEVEAGGGGGGEGAKEICA